MREGVLPVEYISINKNHWQNAHGELVDEALSCISLKRKRNWFIYVFTT